MSTPPYIPEKYLSTADAFKHFGITEELQKDLSAEERTRFQNWAREGNNNVETELINYAEEMPLKEGSRELTYAKSAVLDWVTYKKRQKEGAKNAPSALTDFNYSIKNIIKLLKYKPTTRTVPIQEAEVTDIAEDYHIGYSQTQGYPPEQLY